MHYVVRTSNTLTGRFRMNNDKCFQNTSTAIGFLAFAIGMFGLLACVYGGEKVNTDIGFGLLLTSPMLIFAGLEILRGK